MVKHYSGNYTGNIKLENSVGNFTSLHTVKSTKGNNKTSI